MARKKADKRVVDAILAVLRDGAAPVDAHAAALAFLDGERQIDELDEELALAAVAAAAALGRPDPVARAAEARSKAVRKAARAAAHRLRSAGLAVGSVKTAGTVWTLPPQERVASPPLALLGLPEDDGGVPFLLATFGDEAACVSVGVAGPKQGVRDDDHAHTSRSQARRIIDQARGDHRLFPVPFHDAVAILESAFQSGGEQPDGWSHLLSNLDEGARNAARLLDPMRTLAEEIDVDALHRPEPLIHGPWSVRAMLSTDSLERHLKELLEILSSELFVDEAARRARVEEVVDTAADELVAGAARRSWAFAHDVVAYLAKGAGEDEVCTVARATALAIREGRAGRDIPWVRENANQQLAMLLDASAQMSQAWPVGE